MLQDGSNNNFTSISTPQSYNHLHTVLLGNNSLDLTSTLDGIIKGRHVTSLDIANNRHNNDNYTGRTVIPSYISDMRYLSSVNLFFTNIAVRAMGVVHWGTYHECCTSGNMSWVFVHRGMCYVC